MNHCRYKNISSGAAGFTLVELMVAIFIFGIVISSIFASYSAVFSSAGKVTSGIDRYDMASICMNRISLDLQAMHLTLPPKYRKPEFDADPDPYRLVGETSDSETGRFPRLSFSSLAHIPFDRAQHGGIARIVYYVREGPEGDYQLRRADTLAPVEPFEGSGSDPVLCERLKSLKFIYYDHEGTGHEDWDSESDVFHFATPVAVEILMEIEQEEDLLAFTTTVRIPVVRDLVK
jgi:general secretion pathway protein J